MILSRFSNEDEYFSNCRDKLCSQLTHETPLLADVPLRTVLKVRSEEPEAFIQYRAAIEKIASDYIKTRTNIGKKEAREIYAEFLRPEILKLNSEAKAIRR